METTVLENDMTQKESTTVEEKEQSTTESAPEKADETVEQPSKEESQEPVVELDGEKVPISKVKQWKQEYGNDSKWKDKNRRESEELNKQREKYSRLELINQQLEQRPELLQQILAPAPKRDFDKELKEHYSKRPMANENGYVDVNQYNQWEYQKDLLLAEKAAEQSKAQTIRETNEIQARQWNEEVVTSAQREYLESGKITEDEFRHMIEFVATNYSAQNGRVPKNAFSRAYKELHEDKWLQEIKVKAAQDAVAPVKKAKDSVADAGIKQREQQLTPEDEEDNSFKGRVKQTTGSRKWMTLPT